jgi:trans-aconitate methyltransferase
MSDIANTEQYEAWNGEGGKRWIADADGRDRIMAPIADAVLDAAELVTGERVLDIGCGCGVTTFAAARAVGAGGAAHGVDLSDVMLSVARDRAAAAGLANVTFEQADVQTHPFAGAGFDVAISRFGTMFFADPGAAFANVGTGLRSGGRLCIATWQPLGANDWLAVPRAVLLRYGALPETSGPGMFAQSDPAVITGLLEGAGYTAVVCTPVNLMLDLGAGPEQASEYLASTSIGRAVLDSLSEADRPAALDALRVVFADHQTPTGVELGAGFWLVTATVR